MERKITSPANSCQSAAEPCKRRVWPAVALVLILLLALGLRFYGLDGKSVWCDEWIIGGCIFSPSLHDCVAELQFMMADNMPGVFLLQHAVARLTGLKSAYAVRVEQAVASLGLVLMVFAMGRLVYGTKAGLFAALLFALSPVQIWTAGDFRPNFMMILTAQASIVTLALALKTDRRVWWVLHVLANVLAMSFVVLVFLLMAEGAAILITQWRRPMRVAVLGVFKAGLCLLPLLHMQLNAPITQNVEDDFFMSMPPLTMIVMDALADDAVRVTEPFLFQGPNWPSLSTDAQAALDALHPVADWLLALLMGCAAAWALTDLVRRRGEEAGGRALLLATAFLPLFVVIVLSLAWKPCLMPRYTGYSALSLYVMAGGLVAGFPGRRWRQALGALAGTGIVAAMVYECLIALPAPSRTDFVGAGRFVAAHAVPGDAVVVKGTTLSCDVFASQVNLGIPILPAYTFEEIAQRSAQFLASNRELAGGGSMWAVMERFVLTFPPQEVFEQCLSQRGLRWTCREFPGMNGIAVYRIQAQDSRTPDADLSCAPFPSVVDYEAMAADLVEAGSVEARRRAVAALRRMVDSEWPRSRYYYAWLSLMFCAEGNLEWAQACGRRSVALSADNPFGYFALALALYESGDIAGGDAAYGRASAWRRFPYFRLFGPLLDALYHQGNVSRARVLADELRRGGHVVPFVLRYRTGQLVRPDSLRIEWGP